MHWVFAIKPRPPQQAQAPPLQTGKGTLSPPATAQQQEKTETPLGFAFAAAVRAKRALASAPAAKEGGHKVKPPRPSRQTRLRLLRHSGLGRSGWTVGSQTSAQAMPPQQPATVRTASSPIGQLTTGDSAMGEKTKHETADLIGGTQQGLNGIKRLSLYGGESHGHADTHLPEAGPAGIGQWRHGRRAYAGHQSQAAAGRTHQTVEWVRRSDQCKRGSRALEAL